MIASMAMQRLCLTASGDHLGLPFVRQSDGDDQDGAQLMSANLAYTIAAMHHSLASIWLVIRTRLVGLPGMRVLHAVANACFNVETD